ncbi:hypothetical protein [Photorhabdus temperata]|uniref:hypothetical protein n=1 Tax=Photorhabdus temperata TaxID=574560 RepID=UPI0034DD1F1D
MVISTVLVRGIVALGLGFGIGKLAFWGIQYGLLSESVLRDHSFVSVVVVLLCGLGSFVAYQWTLGGSLEDRSVLPH